MPPSTPPGIHIVSAPAAHDLDIPLAKRVLDLIFASVDSTGTCTIAIAGGSLPAQLGRGLSKLPASTTAKVPWESTHWFLVDERWTPRSHEDSNLGSFLQYAAPHIPADVAVVTETGLVSQGSSSKHQRQFTVYAVDTPSEVTSATPADADELTAAAERYGACLRACLRETGKDAIDIVLLGYGPDGHIASLFPARPRPPVDGATVGAFAVHDSPKPPPRRVTLTSRALHGARVVVIVAAGAGKRAVTEGVMALLKGEAGEEQQAEQAVAARETPLAMLVMARLAMCTMAAPEGADDGSDSASDADKKDGAEENDKDVRGGAEEQEKGHGSSLRKKVVVGGTRGDEVQHEGGSAASEHEGGLSTEMWWFTDQEAAPSTAVRTAEKAGSEAAAAEAAKVAPTVARESQAEEASA